MPTVEMIPPLKGISKGLPVNREQPATSGFMNNVRPRDVLEKRIRLGQRPGLDKWADGDEVGAAEPIVAMVTVSTIE